MEQRIVLQAPNLTAFDWFERNPPKDLMQHHRDPCPNTRRSYRAHFLLEENAFFNNCR